VNGYAIASVSVEEAQRAYDAWGANCGPGALAAVLDKTLEDVQPHLIDFDRKRYTNPSMMLSALRSLGAHWHVLNEGWPQNGLVRVQWEGPWTAPGVPIRARYRHTHWIASRHVTAGDTRGVRIFDINCACVVPKNNGQWHVTHRLEITNARL
jgi:hypothetical protein